MYDLNEEGIFNEKLFDELFEINKLEGNFVSKHSIVELARRTHKLINFEHDNPDQLHQVCYLNNGKRDYKLIISEDIQPDEGYFDKETVKSIFKDSQKRLQNFIPDKMEDIAIKFR